MGRVSQGEELKALGKDGLGLRSMVGLGEGVNPRHISTTFTQHVLFIQKKRKVFQT